MDVSILTRGQNSAVIDHRRKRAIWNVSCTRIICAMYLDCNSSLSFALKSMLDEAKIASVSEQQSRELRVAWVHRVKREAALLQMCTLKIYYLTIWFIIPVYSNHFNALYYFRGERSRVISILTTQCTMKKAYNFTLRHQSAGLQKCSMKAGQSLFLLFAPAPLVVSPLKYRARYFHLVQHGF